MTSKKVQNCAARQEELNRELRELLAGAAFQKGPLDLNRDSTIRARHEYDTLDAS